ncbi:MAG: zf-HC2 domain-containing protein [Terriglobales bacterium]
MPDDTKYGASCSEFEALLSDAIEGTLTGAQKESFDAHRRTCAVCAPLFADAVAGREFLVSLEPVEPPAHLVHNILVATSGVVSRRAVTAGAAGATPRGERLREWWDSWFTPAAAFVRQPRFAMSFGMIFFSFSLALSAAGFKASDIAKIDLRPAAVRHAYNDAQIKVVQYYDNIRFVYEIESKVRELKRANTPAEEPAPQQQQQQQKDHKNDTSGQPEQRQDRNYSCEQGQTVMANMNGPSEAVASMQAESSGKRSSSELLMARDSRIGTRSSALTTNRRFV